MAGPLEAQIVKAILNSLKKEGGFWFKVHGGPFQMVGIPDIVGCYQGRFVAMEVKRAGKKPTIIQRRVMEKIREAGGIVGVVYDVSQALSLIKFNQREVTDNGEKE